MRYVKDNEENYIMIDKGKGKQKVYKMNKICKRNNTYNLKNNDYHE